MRTNENTPLIAALRDAVGHMFEGCRDRPDINAYDDQIHCRYLAWSPKMTRSNYTAVLSPERCVLDAERRSP